jgi:hypothetical protein
MKNKKSTIYVKLKSGKKESNKTKNRVQKTLPI